MRLPVSASTHTMLSENRLSPRRWPPYQSFVALVRGRYTYPSSSSALNNDQRLALPAYFHESSSHVSTPHSPSRGITWKVHRSVPVRTSNARTSPGAASLFSGESDPPAPTMTTSRTTSGADVQEKRVISALMPLVTSTRPMSPNPADLLPVPASSA